MAARGGCTGGQDDGADGGGHHRRVGGAVRRGLAHGGLGGGVLAGVLSLLTSVAGLPEVEG